MSEGIRILIADDSVAARMVMGKLVSRWGYRVELVGEGEEALSRLMGGDPPQMAILDWMMPGLSGVEICSRIRKVPHSPFLYIILVTSRSDPVDMVMGLDAGADDFLSKPVTPEALRSRLAVGSRILGYHRALEEKNRRLGELNRQKDEFLGMAAHDLRNPLHAIRGFAELLLGESRWDPDELREIMGATFRSADGMLSLVEDLLDLSRIQAGRVELHPHPVDVTEMLHKLVELNRFIGKAKGIGILLDPLPVPLPPMRFDLQRVEQVLNNLLGNAIKFSPAGGMVRLGMRLLERGVEFWVSDQGPGIPPREREQIFHAFRQGSTRATGGEKSSGLGLAIVKRLVELHGGSIGVGDGEGGGSRFWFTLPQEG